jgi:cysteine desulfuration protein SufE
MLLPEQLRIIGKWASGMNSIKEIEDKVIQEFENFDSLHDKLVHLYKKGVTLPEMEYALQNKSNKVKGCQSSLWFHITFSEGRMHLNAESDSMMTKGIAAILVMLVDNRRPEEVLQINLNFLEKTGIRQLRPDENPNLNAIVGHLHQQARDEMLLQEMRN